MTPRSVGAEQARTQLPEILEEARHGRRTIITKRGRPYAAVVPVEDAKRRACNVSVLDLRGSGRSLWGRNPAAHVAGMRKEWK
jgi:prevent-host-death family protein